MLDLPQRNFASVRDLLLAYETIAVELIFVALDRHVGKNEELQDSNQDAGGRRGPRADTGEISLAPREKAKQDLLLKHSNSASTNDREI